MHQVWFLPPWFIVCLLASFRGCSFSMTNPSNTSEGSSPKATELLEPDCQPKPPKRARTATDQDGTATTTGAAGPSHLQQDRSAMATALVSASAAPGVQRISRRRDIVGRARVRAAARRIHRTPHSVTERGLTTEGKALEGTGATRTRSGEGRENTDNAEEKQQSRSTASIFKELEWAWSEEETSDACAQVMGNDRAQVFFHQAYSCGTAAARGTQAMSEGQHYWEIKMDSPVYGTAMMIGIGTKQVDLSRYTHTFCNMLGSDTNLESCGLSYTGRFYQGGANGQPYCSKFGQGTVIGLHLDMWFGTLTYYKNGKCLGVASKGLLGKVWHPMVSSTAARSSMCLQTARSFPSSLQFWCCRALRQAIPAERSVLDVLALPPGLRAFLEDNLMWLLDSHSREDIDVLTKGTQTDLSMATHQLSDIPMIRRPTPDTGEEQSSAAPAS